MLNEINLKDINGGINFIDLGASGKLDPYWLPLKMYINLFAFEPNKAECVRLSKLKPELASSTYIPCAIAGSKGEYTLYKTKSHYCWSLLKPNPEWLSRFDFHDLFTIESTEKLTAVTLDDVAELKGVDIDIIKSDTQGLELPILQGAAQFVKNAVVIETETGFAENYIGETKFYQINQFMEQNDFLLFNINTNHRISRKNIFAAETENQQVLWCESLWLKDFVALDKKEGLRVTRDKALKALLLCANHGCIDYGYELAILFSKRGLISRNELNALSKKDAWLLYENIFKYRMTHLGLNVLNLLPNRVLRALGNLFIDLSQRPHSLNKILKLKK